MKAELSAVRPGRPVLRGSAVSVRRILLFNNVLAAISNGAWYVVSPFIPLYLGGLGASARVIGLVFGIAGIVPLLVAIPAGAVADRRGPAGIAAWSVVAYGVAAAALAVLHNIWAVTVAYTLLGAANIGFSVAAQGVVASVSPPRDRLTNFGYYSVWSSGGAVVGPIVGGAIAAQMGYIPTFVLAGLLMVPSFVFAAGLRPVVPPPQALVRLTGAFERVGPILRRPGIPAVLLISFMVVAGQTLQQSFYPLYLSRVGLSQTLIGVVFAAISLSSMLVRSLLSPGRERFGTTGLVLVATGLAALSLGITPWLRGFWPLAGAGALMGAGTGLAFPLTMNLMTAPVPPEQRGVAFGIRQAVQRLATVVSPIAFGAVITALGLRAGFVAGGLVLVAAMPIIAWVSGPLGRLPSAPRGRG
jgi:MFS family permease